ncbi:hypothetical protein TcWFU_002781 [Taenia crassiceps]|uniref:Uncharacterized protein n=1 Tax=Taenia crassiceps TaxID=6207 RepID=A0ABR4QK82_9CEST
MVYSKQLNSYLFFQKFALTVSGPATVISGNAYADKSTHLAPDEYNLDLKKNTRSFGTCYCGIRAGIVPT